MEPYFVGLDVHKQVIAYCVKKPQGEIVAEGYLAATRAELDEWVQTLPQPWHGGMESTLFSHWIYHYLKPHAARLVMGHAARMKAITAGKSKSDKLDARTIADLLRCNLFPECFVMPAELGALRRLLRFRRLLVAERVTFKNKTAGLLLELGVEYERRRLHGQRYFQELVTENPFIDARMEGLLRFNRQQIEMLQQMDQKLVRMLERHPPLRARVEALRKIAGVGAITALTWALEVGPPERFSSVKKAQSYCGLTSALRESAGQQKRGPLSKQRNKHLQSALVEASKLAVQYNPTLAEVHRRARAAGAHKNRASLIVARKLVAYLLAADRAFLAQQQAAGKLAGGVF